MTALTARSTSTIWEPSCHDPINHPACWAHFEKSQTLIQMAYSYVRQSDVAAVLGPWRNSTRSAITRSHRIAAPHTFRTVPDRGRIRPRIGGAAASRGDATVTGPLQGDRGAARVRSSRSAGILKSDRPRSDGPFPCFTYPTIADTLDAAGVSWRYYVEAQYRRRINLTAFTAIQEDLQRPRLEDHALARYEHLRRHHQ